jgi:hypothetical protein
VTKTACGKDCVGEERQKMRESIRNLASIANSEALACLANMEYRVRKEQVRDKIKSSATGRLNYNDEILKVSVSPRVTGGILGNLVQISIEARRRGKEKYYIPKLFSKDELLAPIINKGIQVYEKRIYLKQRTCKILTKICST